MIYQNILQTIGGTPLIKLNKIVPRQHDVFIKMEKFNPGGSIKDRIALAMIEKAEQEGKLKKDTVIIEPTSGNTGVGLALVCAVKGYKLILVMPESMSRERRLLMSSYGAEFVLTPKAEGTSGAVKKAMQLAEQIPNSWVPQQFENKANPLIHEVTTAQEILKELQGGVDYLITGVGTGGHISGVSKVLKETNPSMETFAVEPEDSPVLSGGSPGPHPLQGIGAGFVPKVLDRAAVDGVIKISKEEAFEYTQRLAREEGILAGISTGASIAAVVKQLKDIQEPKKILTFNYDTGERYWSVEGLFAEKIFAQ
ncbi:cysteine synthase A [Planobacterium oryzisoli]|uniref:Cysteine synthase n=1 Tax=Planobacterium oryzisoli TaxID=2771435 RepID=A0A930YUD1_9FLAO|nr:cysteine synthase A [Planobacterium oryzisoli]MBF5026539.1 cysteine synthase A [Planobacterium oryzisoli]